MAFEKGKSGNPTGRPKGSRDRRTLLFEELVPFGGKLLAKAVELALDGDAQMLTLCINKLLANPKPVERHVSLSGLQGRLSDKGETVLGALARGELTPSEAQSLLNALVTQTKLVEVDDLTRRIEALEHAAQ